jgi:hypothetical protein
MTEFREWDWPPYPERHGARRRTSQPVLDLNIQVTRGAGSRKRSLYDRILTGYLGALRIVAGAVAGAIIAVAIWAIATIIRGEAP